MTYGSRSIEVSACVAVDDDCKISYLVFPEQDVIEFTLGGREELAMQTSEAGLGHCVAVFTSALDAFVAAAAAQSDATHADLVPSVHPPTDCAG